MSEDLKGLATDVTDVDVDVDIEKAEVKKANDVIFYEEVPEIGKALIPARTGIKDARGNKIVYYSAVNTDRIRRFKEEIGAQPETLLNWWIETHGVKAVVKAVEKSAVIEFQNFMRGFVKGNRLEELKSLGGTYQMGMSIRQSPDEMAANFGSVVGKMSAESLQEVMVRTVLTQIANGKLSEAAATEILRLQGINYADVVRQ